MAFLSRNTNNGATTEYNLTQEFPTDQEKMDDLFAQRDQVYDLCFNGHFDEIGSMLAKHWPSLLEDNETNVFEHAEHSMRSVIRILHDIWPNNIHHNANGIATTAGHVLDPMLIPTSFRTQGSIGAHMEARNRVAELGEDIATVHHLLNVHRRIMTQLDVMIANCAK
ncbi:uncharacterized protein F5891DRAFT_985136 [Suillus fuscotomentosus]|uniref:Uncharacterized protein n=1 Tax=Suillus fuscotomentosus TaxID=1912939 RepID=A0AAD4DUM7_9AGAM|nr:uncharacterized protein F5891DRAFT_985136 [Suillus fuscotomentosus]KAG1894248.1 hypothetical protein F5891DRAFT_985136 [Suillus fuscotomentosus]